jgi:sugar phosphate permease
MSSTSTGPLTIRKIRLHLLPFLFILYITSYLDRVNIGLAALTMNRALAITSQQFGLLTGIFFIGYGIFEIPSNLFLHKLGARIWIARILISWGALATLNGLVQNVHQLYAARFLLGLAEAGYFPGVCLYLTYWFPKREQARALAVFLLGMPVSSVIGAPLSGLILDHIHWLNLASWRWLLILEGAPPILFGVLTYFILPNRPADAHFLTNEQKNWIHAELQKEELEKEESEKFGHHRSVVAALKNPRVWHLVAVYLTIMTTRYTMSFWAPQIIKSLSTSFSNTAVGLLVMIPSIVAAIAMIFISRSSDRHLERKFHTLVPALAAATAIALLIPTRTPLAGVLLLCVAEVGLCGFLGPFWAMPNEFLSGTAIAVSLALINSIGCLGGFIGPSTVGLLNQHSSMSHSLASSSALAPISLVFLASSLLLASLLLLLLPSRAHRT